MRNIMLITLALFGLPVFFMTAGLVLRVILLRRPWEPTRRCAECQYDLHMNTSGRCPECGKAIPAKQRRYLQEQST